MATTVSPVAASAAEPRPQNWMLRYPPLIVALIGLVLAVVLLPSALNIPQTNPTETAEYAPVPPTDSNAPPGGNEGSLGLAGSSSLTSNSSTNPNGPTNPDDTTGQSQQQVVKVPSTFRCVGKPPRQTEDPFSPPCVAYFNGDNGGSTYQGVTADEIRVIVYWEGGDGSASAQTGNNCGYLGSETSARPDGVYYDFDLPPDKSSSDPNFPESGNYFAPAQRYLDIFFNQHYQLYHRHVHMRLWYSHKVSPNDPNACPTAAERQADAAEQYQAFHPFAVLDYAEGNNDAYEGYMASKNVISFVTQSPLAGGSLVGRHQKDISAHPGLIWSYVPSLETAATWMGEWICKTVVNPNGQPGKVTFSGNKTDIGKPRKYGFIRSGDPGKPLLNDYGLAVENYVKGCGANIDSDMVLPAAGYNIITPSRRNPTSNGYAQKAIAQWIADGVTTVLWGGGDDNNPPLAANGYGWFPEWVVAGDRFFETVNGGFYQNQAEWANAFVGSQVELVPGQYQQECYLAYADADPNATAPGQNESGVACGVYVDYRLLFTGIQIAGPHLDPQHVDQGFHNIPKVASNRPDEPTCYFNPGDYTCIKDAEFMWWDSQKFSPDGNSQGCYRMVKGGHRWLEGNWDSAELPTFKDTANDPCNDYHF